MTLADYRAALLERARIRARLCGACRCRSGLSLACLRRGRRRPDSNRPAAHNSRFPAPCSARRRFRCRCSKWMGCRSDCRCSALLTRMRKRSPPRHGCAIIWAAREGPTNGRAPPSSASPALERYRDGPPLHPRTYPDLHEHVLALAREGLLVIVDEPINKDTEMHPLVRWQYRGGIAEPQRKAFLFTQPTDSKGRRYDISVLVAGLAANRDVYRVGFGKPLETIGAAWVSAIANPIAPRDCRRCTLSGNSVDRQRPRRGWPRARRASGADLDAWLGQRALPLRRPLLHQGSGQRNPERRQLSRPAQGTAAARNESVGGAACRHLRALGEVQGARRTDAVRGRGRLPAGHLLRLRAEAARAMSTNCR